jgi:hypothetical protein
MIDDPYVDQSGILLNKFGLSDQASLNAAEADAVYKRSAILQLNPPKGNFDSEHLRGIHSYLFVDVYAWAGQFRTITLAKKDHDHVTSQQVADSLLFRKFGYNFEIEAGSHAPLALCGTSRFSSALSNQRKGGYRYAINLCFLMFSCLIFESSVDRGIPSFAAAPSGPATLPLLSAKAASIISFS